jgi:prepilin-type N-terminal cleavage/methylation domain-containing protein
MKAQQAEAGFTIIEVIVAMVILGVGLVALAGSSASVSRMVRRGKTSTLAAQVAAEQLEKLRVAAANTSPMCGSTGVGQFVSSAAPVTRQGMQVSWVVPVNGEERVVKVIVQYGTPRRLRSDTTSTIVQCI